MEVNVLGTEYRIETHKVSEDPTLEKNRFAGYCSHEAALIVVADVTEEKYFPDMTDAEREIYRKKTLRHELTHAFLFESGLGGNTLVPEDGWASCEELVDWIALQSPKMLSAFEKAGCL